MGGLKRKKSGVSKDRISSLPTEIIYHILGFLDMKDAVQTSLISKQWRNLWKSVPQMSFDSGLWFKEDSDLGVDEARFTHFVDSVLLLRDDVSIEKFSLGNLLGIDSDNIERWICSAVHQHVREISLEAVHLQAYFINFIGANVRNLRLQNGSLVLAGKEVQLYLSTLEYLEMENCGLFYDNRFGLHINAPELRQLILNNCFRVHSCLSITAPKLSSLKCTLDTRNEYFLEMPSLTSACIPRMTTWMADKVEEQATFGRCLNDLFRGVLNAEYLALPARILQSKAFSEVPRVPRLAAFSFHNLRHLKLTHWSNNGYIRPILQLLEMAPHLESLVLERTKVMSDLEKKGDWKLQLMGSEVCPHLRFIEIKNFEGCANERKFLGFLLRNSRLIEKITLTTSQIDSKLVRFCNELQHLPKASPSIRILLIFSIT